MSKPGVTQMTSWPWWASGTDLGDLGAGRLIRLWPRCAPAGCNNNRRPYGKTLTPSQTGTRLLYIIFEGVVLGWWPGKSFWAFVIKLIWMNSMLTCLCLPLWSIYPQFSYQCNSTWQNTSASSAHWWRFSSQMPWFNHVVSKLLTFLDLLFLVSCSDIFFLCLFVEFCLCCNHKIPENFFLSNPQNVLRLSKWCVISYLAPDVIYWKHFQKILYSFCRKAFK